MGWTVRGLNSGGGEIFCTCPDRPWGPPSLLYSGYQIFPGGKERPGRDTDPSPPSSAVGHDRVELYLYSPYGLYGLYRASVPVQGYTLHFTLLSNPCVGPPSTPPPFGVWLQYRGACQPNSINTAFLGVYHTDHHFTSMLQYIILCTIVFIISYTHIFLSLLWTFITHLN